MKLPVFKDKDGHIALWQSPNIPLYGWLLFKLVSMLLENPQFKNGSAQLSTAFLFTWAFLEVTQGINYFRRALGLIIITMIIVGYFTKHT